MRIFLAIPALFLSAALGGAGAFRVPYRGRGGRYGGGWRRRARGRLRVPRLVRDPRARPDAEGPPRRGRVQRRLQRADARVRPARHRSLSERRPDGDARRRSSGRRSIRCYLVGDAHDLRRSRVLVFFRLPLAIPHLVWLALWTVAAVLVGILNWFATLFTGTPPRGRSTASSRAYVRYTLHVYAFLYLAANPFPGFAGERGPLPARRRAARSRSGRTAG